NSSSRHCITDGSVGTCAELFPNKFPHRRNRKEDRIETRAQLVELRGDGVAMGALYQREVHVPVGRLRRGGAPPGSHPFHVARTSPREESGRREMPVAWMRLLRSP